MKRNSLKLIIILVLSFFGCSKSIPPQNSISQAQQGTLLVPNPPLSEVKNNPPKIWFTSCDDDTMENQRTCTARCNAISVILMKSKRLPLHHLITWGGTSYPGSENVVRIDNNSPIRWDEDEYPSIKYQQVIKQMRKGSSVKTRYRKWPGGGREDAECSLEGFDEAYKEILEKMKEFKP